MNLLAELRRRSVFRVAAAYLIAGWVVLQVVELIAGVTGLPAWASAFALVLLIVGLPIALIIAWAFELTPEGPKRTEARGEAETIKPFRPADAILVAGLVVVIGAIIWQQVWGPSEIRFAEEERITGQSIAVLPFLAISEAPEDVVLGDGLAEELLNVLAQFPDLMVAGRTSSFAFRDQAEDLRAIGDGLGVNHVLEGSVRRLGQQVRVTAQLIRTADGFHVWSGTYDRPIAEIMAVQDDIIRQLAQVLTVRLGIGASARENVHTANPAAYEQYLQGRYLFAERETNANRYAAIDAFQTAIDIDPDFAAAWAALARAVSYSDPPEGVGRVEFKERGRRVAERALALDLNNAEAFASLAYWASNVQRDWAASEDYIERALELAPNAAYAHYTEAIIVTYLGDDDRVAAAMRRAIALDPLNQTIRRNAIERYIDMGRLAEARRLLAASQFSEFWRAFLSVDFAFATRDADAMVRAAEEVHVATSADEYNSDPIFAMVVELLLAIADAMRGNVEAVEQRLPSILSSVGPDGLNEADIANVYYFLGDYPEAARRFLVAAEDPNVNIPGYVIWPYLPEDREFLCHPDYHAVWEAPGMPELAEIRRANGATESLPLSGPECDAFLAE